MNDSLFSLLGVIIGLLAGVGAGKLAVLALPFVRQAAPERIGNAAPVLALLAVIGGGLGMLVRSLFDHESVLLGALIAFLFFVHPLLRQDD